MNSHLRWLIPCFAALCLSAQYSYPTGNSDGKWGLHFAGPHDAGKNNCAFALTDCSEGLPATDGPSGRGRYDVFVLALDVDAVAGTRYGLCCEGSFYFYGWTSCSDFDVTTAGWPACGGGSSQTWGFEQRGPNVTIGVLDIYVYGASVLEACVDSRTGFAEWCDGSSPSPVCDRVTDSGFFGAVGFGRPGYNPCDFGGAAEKTSWGRLKSFYRE